MKKREDSIFENKSANVAAGQMRARRKWCAAATLLLALVLAFAPAAGSIMRAYAEEEEMSEEEKARKELLEKTYKIEVASNKIQGWPKGPGTYGEAACVVDMDTGAILYDKKMNDKHYPASITKVMTAYVTCKYGDLNGKVAFYPEDMSFLEPGDAAIGMQAGEVMTMNDAMHAMLLQSANEVSHAIIRTVGRKVRTEGQIAVPGAPKEAKNEQVLDYKWGIALMNMEAQMIGCTNSHFVNSYGLHDKYHYVTAHDMCLIGAAAYQYEYFRKVTQTLRYKIPRYAKIKGKGEKKKVKANKDGLLTVEPREFIQNHKMLHPNHERYYKYCTGGKTGFTDQAGTTLITFAEKDGRKLVCTCLHTYGAAEVYGDTKALLEYGFKNFEKKAMSFDELSRIAKSSGGRTITMIEDQSPTLTLPKGADLSAVSGKAAFDLTDISLDKGYYQFYFGNLPAGRTKVHYESLHQAVATALNTFHRRFSEKDGK